MQRSLPKSVDKRWHLDVEPQKTRLGLLSGRGNLVETVCRRNGCFALSSVSELGEYLRVEYNMPRWFHYLLRQVRYLTLIVLSTYKLSFRVRNISRSSSVVAVLKPDSA